MVRRFSNKADDVVFWLHMNNNSPSSSSSSSSISDPESNDPDDGIVLDEDSKGTDDSLEDDERSLRDAPITTLGDEEYPRSGSTISDASSISKQSIEENGCEFDYRSCEGISAQTKDVNYRKYTTKVCRGLTQILFN